MIIAIISPIRFKDEMMKVYTELSLAGDIVLLPVDLTDANLGNSEDEYKELLMQLHKTKIDMADIVCVVNVDGYMGRGTYEEIGYAYIKGKQINYLNTPTTLKANILKEE